MQKVKIKGHVVLKLKSDNRRTDRQTNGGDCITSRANAVGKYVVSRQYRPVHYCSVSIAHVSFTEISTAAAAAAARQHHLLLLQLQLQPPCDVSMATATCWSRDHPRLVSCARTHARDIMIANPTATLYITYRLYDAAA